VSQHQDDAAIWNGLGRSGCPFRAYSFWGTVFPRGWPHGLEEKCPLRGARSSIIQKTQISGIIRNLSNNRSKGRPETHRACGAHGPHWEPRRAACVSRGRQDACAPIKTRDPAAVWNAPEIFKKWYYTRYKTPLEWFVVFEKPTRSLTKLHPHRDRAHRISSSTTRVLLRNGPLPRFLPENTSSAIEKWPSIARLQRMPLP
jgi:hypothetical protein